MQSEIRKMREADIKQVQHVAKQSWHVTYEGIIPLNIQNNFLRMAYSDEMMKRRLEGSHMFVAEVNDEVVGFANYAYVNDQGQSELSAIYLLPKEQGKGIGTALLEEGIHTLQNVKEIYVNVEKDNGIGVNFYRAKGFQIVKEFDDNFDGHVLKTIRMKLVVE